MKPDFSKVYLVETLIEPFCQAQYKLQNNLELEYTINYTNTIQLTQIKRLPYFEEIIPTHLIYNTRDLNEVYLGNACHYQKPSRNCFGYFQKDRKSYFKFYFDPKVFQILNINNKNQVIRNPYFQIEKLEKLPLSYNYFKYYYHLGILHGQQIKPFQYVMSIELTNTLIEYNLQFSNIYDTNILIGIDNSKHHRRKYKRRKWKYPFRRYGQL